MQWNRVLPLEGAFNLRDFGGYPSAHGGHIRRGMLYRSGTMHHLSEADERHLATLGIVTVCDLRRTVEREAQPTRWCEAAGVEILSGNHHQTAGVLEEMLGSDDVTAAAMRDAMLRLYRILAYEHSASYRTIFERLLDDKAPLLLNCAAGKDRTGVGVALILSALDVPRDVISADYAMTADVADFNRVATGRYLRVSRELIAPLFASDPEYLATMFAEIEGKHGSVHAFLASELGVTELERARLRELLVE